MCPPLSGFYFTQKLFLSSTGIFHENSLMVACWSFGRFEIRTPNRFKTQTKDTSKLLACNCNYLQEFVKQKKSLSIIVLLSKNFRNTFIKITIWVNFINIAVVTQNWNNTGPNVCVHSSPIMQHDGECLTNPCWWLELPSSNFNVLSVWFLNLFGIKVLISSLPNIQAQLGNFCGKLSWRRAPQFLCKIKTFL